MEKAKIMFDGVEIPAVKSFKLNTEEPVHAVKSYEAYIKAHGNPEALAKLVRARLDGYPETIPNLIGAWNDYQRIRDFIEDYPELF